MREQIEVGYQTFVADGGDDDPSTFYGGGAKGYTDYPTLAQERGEEPKSCVDDRWR